VGRISGAQAYPLSRAICLQAKKSGHGLPFRQPSFRGSATLSWSTLLLRSSRREPWRIGLWRAENLTTIYATHGHGDHFFGTNTVLERFPGARFVARPDVIKVMRQQASAESLGTFWNPRFPGQISSHRAIAEELEGNVIRLEGHDLVSVPLGYTDTANTTCLHVPSIGLIVAGDAAYNGDHLHLSESPDQQKRQEWIAALDKMESLKPRAVIAGHKRVGNDDSPRIIGETRKYIRDFERLAMQTTTARELYDQMLELYPDWINRGALWSSVRAMRT